MPSLSYVFARGVQHMQSDFAHLGFARLDVAAQQQLRVLGLAL